MLLQAQLDAMHLGILKDAPSEGAAFDTDTEQLVQAGTLDGHVMERAFLVMWRRRPRRALGLHIP
jgi:hypothetical protein